MTALCLLPPTPAFKEGSLYECEPIPGGMVVYDSEGFAFVCDAREFRRQFQVLGRKQIIQSIRRLTIWDINSKTIDKFRADLTLLF